MKTSFRLGELLIFFTGVLLLFNVWYIGLSGDFTYWVIAKALYLAGTVLFIFGR